MVLTMAGPGPLGPARERFELLDEQLGAVLGRADPPTNDSGTLAWGTAWVLHAYLVMFETTGDPDYLHRLSRAADWILAQRDCDRGISDYQGLSSPAWSSTGAFTVATASVPGSNGSPALGVRVCPPGAIATTVEVRPGGAADTTTLVVTGPGGARDVLADVSLDHTQARYAPRVAYQAYPGTTRVTVEVPEQLDGVPGTPVSGLYPCIPARVTLAAQTGMITHPIAALARIVRANPGVGGAALSERCDHYLEGVVAALAVHDHQWRQGDRDDGHYAWLRDEPVSFAGVELPTNEFLAMGRAHAQLAAVTSDGPHRERAEALARTLRAEFRRRRGCLVWSYWPSFGHVHRGWSKTGSSDTDVSSFRPQFDARTKLEDVTHALLDVDFVVAYQGANWLPEVFTEEDMVALARTYSRRVAYRKGLTPIGPVAPKIRRNVTGWGRLAGPAQQPYACGWLGLSPWNPHIRQHVALVLEELGQRSSPIRGVDAYCASLWARWGAPSAGLG